LNELAVEQFVFQTGVASPFGIPATSLGLTILLTVLWVYLPMLLAAPRDVVALNYFFDTLLFCGAILLLANAMEKETAVARS
jgi:hypothetical protein